jgi:hypothetical protein
MTPASPLLLGAPEMTPTSRPNASPDDDVGFDECRRSELWVLDVAVAVAVGVDQDVHLGRVRRLRIVRQPCGGLLGAFAPWIAQRDHAQRRRLVDRERLPPRAVRHLDGVMTTGEHAHAQVMPIAAALATDGAWAAAASSSRRTSLASANISNAEDSAGRRLPMCSSSALDAFCTY